jgi:hypothetical protein
LRRVGLAPFKHQNVEACRSTIHCALRWIAWLKASLKSNRRNEMKLKPILITLAAAAALSLFAVNSDAAASSKFIGTWSLDLSKMPASPPPPKSITLVTSDVGGGKWKSSVTTVAPDGKSSGNSVTYAIDGKDYPVTGDPGIDTDAFASPDPNTLVITQKKAGKLVSTLTTKLSADGNTQDATTVSADGKTTTTDVWKRK